MKNYKKSQYKLHTELVELLLPHSTIAGEM